MNRFKTTRALSLAAVAMAALVFTAIPAGVAQAATLTWDANALGDGQPDGGGAWLGTGQWWDGAANQDWVFGSDANFGNGGAGGAVTLASPTTVGLLTMNPFTGTYTLGTAGQAITLNSGILVNSGAGATTIISPVTLGGAQSWTNSSTSLLTVGTGAVDNGGFLLTVGGTGNTTITSAIGGAGGLSKDGAGTLTLTGANTYTGATNVTAGVLKIQHATALGTTAGGVSVDSGAALQIQGGITVGAEALTLNGTGVSNDGALRNISGNNTYGGLVTLGSAARINSDSGTLTLDVASGNAIAGDNMNLTLGGAGNITVADPIATGTGTLTKDGAGTLTLSGANTYSGGTVINGGSLSAAADTNLGAAGGGITVNASASFLPGGVTYARSITLNNGATLTFANNNNPTFTGNVTGTGGLAQNTGFGSQVVFSGTGNTFEGKIAIGSTGTTGQAYRFAFASLADSETANGRIVFSSSKVTHANGSVFEYTGTSNLVLANRQIELASATGNPTNGHQIRSNGTGTLTINTDLIVSTAVAQTLALKGTNTGNNTFAGKIGNGSGTVSLLKADAGLWILSGDNSYTGGTTVSAGTLKANAAGTLGSGFVTVTGGTLVIDAADAMADAAALSLPSATTKNLTMNANDTIAKLYLGGVQQLYGVYSSSGAGSAWMNAGSGILTVGSAAVQPAYWDLNGTTAGAGGATPTGIWDGANAYWNDAPDGTGSTAAWTPGRTAVFSAGTDATGTYTVTVDGTQDIAGLSFEEGNVTLSTGTDGGLRMTSDTVAYVAAGTTTIATPISQDTARALSKTGAGTLVLTSANSHTGPTTVSQGTLRLSNANAIASSSGLNVTGGNVVLDTTVNVAALSFVSSSNLAVNGGTLAMTGGTIAQTNTAANLNVYDTITSGISGSPTVNLTTTESNTYISGLQFAPAGNATQALGTITAVKGANDKANIYLGGQSTGNTVASITYTSTGYYGVVRKRGIGEWTLGSVSYGTFQNYAGTTIAQGLITGSYQGVQVYGGTLVLDYTVANSDRVSSGVTLNGGTLQLDRSTGATGTYIEVVTSTTLSGGWASVTRGAGSTATLRMNAITRSAGATLNFGASGIADTDTLNSNGILGPWATVAGADFATNSTNAGDGAINAYTGYTDVQRLTPGTIADGSTTNVRLIEGSGSAGDIALGAATTTINTLNQSASGGAGAATIDPAGQTLSTNAILAGAGSGALTIGTGTDNGTIKAATAGGELIVHNYSSNPLTINSVIADNTSASRLTLTGTGTTILAGLNTYTGITRISGGVLQAGLGTGLSASTYLQLDGGVLQSSGSFTRANSTTAGGANFQWSSETGGGFAAQGGKLTVTIGNNAATEQTWAWVANSAAVGLATGNNAILGPLKFGSATADSEVEFQNKINLNGETRNIDVTAGVGGDFATLSGVIRNSSTVVPAGIVKTGAGTLKLTAANTYDGATIVNAGTLLVSGSLAATAGKVTVNANGTLGGTGTIASDVDVLGTLAPGASIESLDTGNLLIAATGKLDVELGRNSGNPVSDIVNVTGTVTLAAGANLKLTVYSGLDNPVRGDIFYLVANDSDDAATGVFTKLNGVDTELNEGSTFTWNSQSWKITYTADAGLSFAGGNDIALKVVPEPATVGLLAIGGLALLRRRRRA
jgi:autotransporter-associated beta strand protein